MWLNLCVVCVLLYLCIVVLVCCCTCVLLYLCVIVLVLLYCLTLVDTCFLFFSVLHFSYIVHFQPLPGGGFVFLIVLFSGGAVVGAFLLFQRVMSPKKDRDEGGEYPSASTSTLQNDTRQPLMSGVVESHSYATAGGGGGGGGGAASNDAATDDMFAKMLANANGTSAGGAAPAGGAVSANGGVEKQVVEKKICPACGEEGGVTTDSNFCGLCGSKIRSGSTLML